jgi:hypothetical protein
MVTSHLYMSAEEWRQYAQTTDEWGTVRWFGPDWHALINRPETRIETPVGVSCHECAKPVESGQRGVAIPAMSQKYLTVYHHGCFMQTILGPHWQEMTESVIGVGVETDPDELD